jgi:hypothetical protein
MRGLGIDMIQKPTHGGSHEPVFRAGDKRRQADTGFAD